MNTDYAQWPLASDSPDLDQTSIVIEAVFYELLRISVVPTSDDLPNRNRFRDVAVTHRDGIQRFVAGYTTVTGDTALNSPIGITGHAPTAGLIERNPARPADFLLTFPGASVLEHDGDLTVLDNGFGVDAARSSMEFAADGARISLTTGSSMLLVGGPSRSKIRNRYALAGQRIDLLPSY